MDRRKRAVRRDFRLDRGQPEHALIEIEIVDGLKIAARNDIRDFDTWVLFEQEDWFEPETAWLRRVVQPGWRCLDGAPNCGVLAASMARCAGPAGRVVALEPAPRRRGRLQFTRSANDLGSLEIRAVPTADTWSEAARLIVDDPFDLVRLGQEAVAPLLDGLPSTCRADPMLVICLEGADRAARTALTEGLTAKGYDLYHHLAGFEVVAPFEVGFTDDFALNLIAARPERAAALAARGLLVTSAEAAAARSATQTRMADRRSSRWPDQLARATSCLLGEAPIAERVADAEDLAIEWLGGIRDFVDLIDRPARLIALARLLAACGARVAALEALRPLLHRVESGTLVLDEPTIAISTAFDPPARGETPDPIDRTIGPYEPDDPALTRLKHSIVDAMCRLMAHSSCIGGAALHPILSLSTNRDHLSPELERRRQLMALRSGDQATLEPTPTMLRSRNHRFVASRRRAA